MKLLIGKKRPRPNNKFFILSSPGSTPTRRRGGWSDYSDYFELEAIGWLERRPTGPRGGTTWWPTRKGKYHLKKARGMMVGTTL